MGRWVDPDCRFSPGGQDACCDGEIFLTKIPDQVTLAPTSGHDGNDDLDLDDTTSIVG